LVQPDQNDTEVIIYWQ